jgi:hypothetical protein
MSVRRLSWLSMAHKFHRQVFLDFQVNVQRSVRLRSARRSGTSFTHRKFSIAATGLASLLAGI